MGPTIKSTFNLGVVMKVITPAYGRIYKSKKAFLKEWYAGKDFLCDNSLISKYDAPLGYYEARFGTALEKSFTLYQNEYLR